MSTTGLDIKQANILNITPSPSSCIALGLFCKVGTILLIFRAVLRIKEDKMCKVQSLAQSKTPTGMFTSSKYYLLRGFTESFTVLASGTVWVEGGQLTVPS